MQSKVQVLLAKGNRLFAVLVGILSHNNLQPGMQETLTIPGQYFMYISKHQNKNLIFLVEGMLTTSNES